jgi:kynurenine formamidase
MLDLPRLRGVRHLSLGEVVTVDMMEECARGQNRSIRSGDVLLLRTGWYTVFHEDRALWEQGEPGPDVSCTAWLKEREIIAVGADNAAVESAVYRHRDSLAPRLHVTALRDLGVYLIENLNLEDLARDHVYEFLFVTAPLRLTNASGAPYAAGHRVGLPVSGAVRVGRRRASLTHHHVPRRGSRSSMMRRNWPF